MTRYRWMICSMLFLATTVNYLDRQVLSLTWKDFIVPEFHWSNTDYGNITAIFSITYALSMLVAGRFVDWLGTKKGYLWAIGIWSMKNIPLDAIPDLSDTQVIVYSRWDRSPDIMEDQVTYPIVTSMLGAPRVKAVRGFSDFGYSFVYIVFEDGTDIYWARSRTLEYLSSVLSKLPPEVKTLAEALRAPALADHRALGMAASQIATTHIRNTGTVGGNLCAANFEAPRGDLQGALIALGAHVRSAGKGGERTEPIEDFLPARAGRLVLDVAFDEVVNDFALPIQSHALTYLLNVPETEAATYISWGIHVFRDGGDGQKKGAALGGTW